MNKNKSSLDYIHFYTNIDIKYNDQYGRRSRWRQSPQLSEWATFQIKHQRHKAALPIVWAGISEQGKCEGEVEKVQNTRAHWGRNFFLSGENKEGPIFCPLPHPHQSNNVTQNILCPTSFIIPMRPTHLIPCNVRDHPKTLAFSFQSLHQVLPYCLAWTTASPLMAPPNV